ncbi:MAG: CoA-binding protein, partial [Symbiobacteriaceae bacterium]
MIETLFRPRGIAVAGASRYPTKPGHQVLHNLLTAGYPGQIALVHPEAQSILGVPAYPALEQVPTVVEMLILAAPAASTPAMAESIVRRKQTRGDLAVVVSLAGGFAESATDEGRRHQEMLAAACREAGLGLWIGGMLESGVGRVDGLGLLDADIEFAADKTLRRWERPLRGYEIHHGQVTRSAADDWHGVGLRRGAVCGTHWHGLLDN